MSLLLSGKKISIPGKVGLGCRVAGDGPPVLLVHGVSCSSSMVEMLPMFDALQNNFTVIALDLPGFGSSDRGPQDYSARFMTDALHRAAAWTRAQFKLGPRYALDAVAYGLSAEFLARAAVEDPVRWGRLALISPTGLNGPGHSRRERWVRRSPKLAHKFFHAANWSQDLFELLTTPAVVRYNMKRWFGTNNIDGGLISQSVAVTRAEGARYAPFAYLSGKLESPDIEQIYLQVEQPVWVTHGTRGLAAQFRHNPVLQSKPNWRLTAFGAGLMPHFQNTPTFVRVLTHFLRDGA